jgi:3-hydroxyacyl-CoA dehydrogenase
VIFKDLNEDLLKKCRGQVGQLYASAMKKGKITEEDVKKGLALIRGRTDYQGFERIDLVIEAVPEDIGIKKAVFQEMNRFCKPEAIFASNTSALPISELASLTKRQPKFIGALVQSSL